MKEYSKSKLCLNCYLYYDKVSLLIFIQSKINSNTADDAVLKNNPKHQNVLKEIINLEHYLKQAVELKNSM